MNDQKYIYLCYSSELSIRDSGPVAGVLGLFSWFWTDPAPARWSRDWSYSNYNKCHLKTAPVSTKRQKHNNPSRDHFKLDQNFLPTPFILTE